MDFMQKVYKTAKTTPRRIVLPESNDARILHAAQQAIEKGYGRIILIGNPSTIKQRAQEEKCDISKVEIIDPKTHPKTEEYIKIYCEKRAKKGMTMEKAKVIISEDPLFFGAMLVYDNEADGMVAGAVRPTADTMRAMLHCIGTAKGIQTVSSFFAMVSPKTEYGSDGLMFFADCAVNPNPTSEQLADIAISTADNYSLFTGQVPKVALLSFSTKGSVAHEDVDKVSQAFDIVKKARPDIQIDGELQFDSATVESIGQRKAPGSRIAGHANVFVFPDLDAGNIGYKIAQRLGNCKAIGPVVQGGAKPINDLSRGCTVEDIVDLIAITATQVK
jgi:phosphate acetyltransferase